MLNRRFLRIKILQSLYAYYQSGDKEQEKYLNDLFLSIDRIYELYLYLILSITELNLLAKEKFENKTPKIFPTKDDIDPNMKWIENSFVSKITESVEFKDALKKHKVNWIGVENQEMLKKVFKQIIQSETYFEYMNNSTFDFNEDKTVIITGTPSKILDSEFYLGSDDVIYEGEEKLLRDYILISSSNLDFKFYPYFKISSEYGLNEPENSE